MIIPEPTEKELDQVDVFNRCLGVLKSAKFCTLATTLNAKPRARTMEYAVDDAGIIYMLTEGGRKIRDILLNMNVSLALWEADADTDGLRGLTIIARAEVVDRGDAKRFEEYYGKYSHHIGREMPPISDLPPGVKLIRAVPDSMELFDRSLPGTGFAAKQVWRR